MLTYQELWEKACKSYGQFISSPTFRRWVSEACLLPIQPTYETDEIHWVMEWVKTSKRFPKGSPRAKAQIRPKRTPITPDRPGCPVIRHALG
jgi:hypothetical protein